ncbi:MAG: CMP deaminase [Xanthomonadales bacterium]|jgi:deoxycytidylate deaminase|nr:CMP deaminase [Xanthomonadales bacterium]
MATSATIAKLPTTMPSEKKGKFIAKNRIDQAITPEIVIALCGPLGTPLHRVSEILKDILSCSHDYKRVDEVRLSDFIRQLGKPSDTKSIRDLIDAGNRLRQEHGNSVLAQLAIRQIATVREQARGARVDDGQLQLDGVPVPEQAVVPTPVVRHCHIINSIKNIDELQLLRAVYGRIFHLISVYSPIDLRAQELQKRLLNKKDVYDLIDRDSGEEIENGQSVRDVFPQADFFLRINDGTDGQIRANLTRYLDLLLGVKIITPTVDERAMYEAHSAARNSACLSRQVGAAITDKLGEVLSVGWNDVPRAFGGLYETFGRPGENGYVDHRCWNKDGGKCFNDEEKSEIAGRLTRALIREGIVEASKEEEVNSRLRGSSEVRGLIEFSRAVHAEMHAILNAGHSSGARINGGKLYVTTYPCHSCARHIIAAGIEEVRFIEPYQAVEIHPTVHPGGAA